MGLAAAALAMAVATASAPSAGHDPGPDAGAVALQWDAPAPCPDAAALRRELARYVSADAPVGERPLQVRARISEQSGGFALELELDAAGGVMKQRIVAARCEVLASATALVIAVLLDPAGVVERVEPPEAPAPPPNPEPEPTPPIATPTPTPPPATPKSRRSSLQAIVRFAAMGGTGVLPRFGAGFSGAIGLRGRLFRAEIVATGMLPQRERVDTQDAGARFDAWSVGPRGCVVPAVRSVEFPICTGLDAGQIRARGFGLRTNQRPTAAWLAVPLSAMVLWAPRLRAQAPSRRFAFGPGIEGWVATGRPGFGIDDLGPLHRASRAGVRAFLTVELRLP